MKFVAAVAASLLMSAPAFAEEDVNEGPATKRGGARLELHLGFENPQLTQTEGRGFNQVEYIENLGSSVVFGGEVGYDIQVSNSVTVGPYASYDLGSSKKCSQGITTDGRFNYNFCTKSKSNTSIGARIASGLGKGEGYFSLGYDMFDLDVNIALTPRLLGQTPGTVASTKMRKGVGLGFGYNHQLNKTMYLGGGLHISALGKFEGSEATLIRGSGRINLGARF